MKSDIEVSISCKECVRRGTPDCSDCLVSFVIGDVADELAMTSGDIEVVELFNAQGMIPSLRYRDRATRE